MVQEFPSGHGEPVLLGHVRSLRVALSNDHDVCCIMQTIDGNYLNARWLSVVGGTRGYERSIMHNEVYLILEQQELPLRQFLCERYTSWICLAPDNTQGILG